jgi:hypothetical protein
LPREKRSPDHPAMPTFVKFLLACLLCLTVAGGVVLLVEGLFG